MWIHLLCFQLQREVCIDICCSWYQAELNQGSIHRSNLSVNADLFPSVIPVNNVWPHVKKKQEHKGGESGTHRLGSCSHRAQSHIKGKEHVSPSSVLVLMQPWKLHIDSVSVAERISLQRKGYSGFGVGGWGGLYAYEQLRVKGLF